MIEREQLEYFAELYERGFLSFDGTSKEAVIARLRLNNELWESYRSAFRIER